MTSSSIAAMDMMPCHPRLPTQTVLREEIWGFSRAAKRRLVERKTQVLFLARDILGDRNKRFGAMADAKFGARPRQLAERYSGTVGTSASGWDIRAERSMAMAAYAITPVTTQRISVR
jgi:hypothetical protein